MGKLTLILLLITTLTLNACNHAVKTTEDQNKTSIDTIVNPAIESQAANIEDILKHDKNLINILTRAAKIYPDDSASLIDFYGRISSKDQRENQKHIKRVEGLISNSNVDQYQLVHDNLKPLMVAIISSDTISISQAGEFVKYYSFYDDFCGESLFSNLLTDDENYKLAWESIRKITQTPIKDTTYISIIIELNNNIRTNAELAEAMEDFVIESIKNNPKGFLDMFLARKPEGRKSFSYNITYFEDPNADLIRIFKEISAKSEIKYQNAAKELLEYQTTNNE
jgi:hypothetical protein